MMIDLSSFGGYLQNSWLPHYPLLLISIIVLGLVLIRVTRGAMRYVAHMLLLFFVLLLAGASAGSLGSPGLAQALPQIATLVLGMVLIRQIGLILFRMILPKLGMRSPRILEELLILLAYIAWVLLRLSAAGLDPSSLVASTAVVTAVAAFAMQDTLGNILSGLALQLDHSIHKDDWIEIDTIGGRVIEVQWRHTAIRALTGERVLIPNSHLMRSQVMLTRDSSTLSRLRTVKFYCGFEVPPARVIAEVEGTFANAQTLGVAQTPETTCALTNFADGVIEYCVRYWLTDPESPGGTDSLVRQHLYAIFRRNNWHMAAPARELRAGSDSRRRAVDALQREADTRIAALENLPFFSLLTGEELQQLSTQMHTTPYVAGSLITRQGELGDCLYILVSGQIDVWLEDGNKRHPLAVLDPVQIMGEMSLLTGEPRSATLTARSDVECHILGQDSFQTVLRNRPELAESFAQLLTERGQQRAALREKMSQSQTSQQHEAIVSRIRKLFGLAPP